MVELTAKFATAPFLPEECGAARAFSFYIDFAVQKWLYIFSTVFGRKSMSVRTETNTVTTTLQVISLNHYDYGRFKWLERLEYILSITGGVGMIFSWWVLPFWIVYHWRDHVQNRETMMLWAIIAGMTAVALSVVISLLLEKRRKKKLNLFLQSHGWNGTSPKRVELVLGGALTD
jgi:hypothetical protein